jgi:hypothetical protein
MPIAEPRSFSKTGKGLRASSKEVSLRSDYHKGGGKMAATTAAGRDPGFSEENRRGFRGLKEEGPVAAENTTSV